MAKEPNEQKPGSSLDALRLERELAQNITWGNSSLNALQVVELTKISDEALACVRNAYREQHSSIFLEMALIGLSAGGAFGYLYLKEVWWLQMICALVGISSFYALARLDGQADGYLNGYKAGHLDGMYKAIGIKPEDKGQMYRMAVKMIFDDAVIDSAEPAERQEGGNLG